jgi:dipeptidyl aminopeptidase/acylaminoacyl peptidase
MVVEQAFSVRNSSGDDIFGDVRFQEGDRPSPVIVVCHGFTAHKDWGPFPYIGRRLASSGFVSVVFNFSHNGIGPGRTKFTEFAKFSRNTVGKELEDVRAIVDAVAVGDIARTIADPLRIGVAGHSRGGGIAILAASRDRRIGAVAGWSTVATFYRYTEHQRALWERDGYLPISIRASRTRLRFGIEVLRDLESHRDEYDLALLHKQRPGSNASSRCQPGGFIVICRSEHEQHN